MEGKLLLVIESPVFGRGFFIEFAVDGMYFGLGWFSSFSARRWLNKPAQKMTENCGYK
jgi:hypothetical protein